MQTVNFSKRSEKYYLGGKSRNITKSFPKPFTLTRNKQKSWYLVIFCRNGSNPFADFGWFFPFLRNRSCAGNIWKWKMPLDKTLFSEIQLLRLLKLGRFNRSQNHVFFTKVQTVMGWAVGGQQQMSQKVISTALGAVEIPCRTLLVNYFDWIRLWMGAARPFRGVSRVEMLQKRSVFRDKN